MNLGRANISVFLVLLIGVGLVGGSFENVMGQTRKPDHVKFMMDWAIGGKYSPYFVASEKGWYRDEGIDIEIMRGYGPSGAAVDQGKATFGLAAVANAALVRSKGGDVKIIGMILNDQITGFASLAETGIKTPKDMEGRTVATTVKSSAVLMLPIFAKVNGIDLNKIKIVYLDGSVLVPALLKKEVELSSLFKTALWEVLVSIARKKGIKVSLLAFSDWGLDMYDTSIVAKEKLLKENPDLVKRFLRATYKGLNYSIAHSDEAIGILKKYHPEVNEEIGGMQLDTCLELLQSKEAKEKGLGWISEEKMRRTLSLTSKAYKMQFKFRSEDLYTNKFLPGKF
jgi:NitT/TauT family transport system substrate-binding protein